MASFDFLKQWKIPKEWVEKTKEWRINKCGTRWASGLDKEFSWRLKNNIPMELSYSKAREYYKKNKMECDDFGEKKGSE